VSLDGVLPISGRCRVVAITRLDAGGAIAFSLDSVDGNRHVAAERRDVPNFAAEEMIRVGSAEDRPARFRSARRVLGVDPL
jgi:hypothetical protein